MQQYPLNKDYHEVTIFAGHKDEEVDLWEALTDHRESRPDWYVGSIAIHLYLEDDTLEISLLEHQW